MIAPDHAAVALIFSHRANKKIIRNRNLRSSKTSVQIGQMLASENVAAFDANNFALTNWFDGEQTLALDRTRPYSRLFDRYDSFDINKLPPPLDTWFNQINTIAIEILKHCDLPVGFFPRNPP